MLRSIPLIMLLPLAACAPAATSQPEKQFVLADPAKYKTEAERQHAQQVAETDCKAKALSASTALEKTIASERNSLENIERAREKAAEMYTASFTLCMFNGGYVKKQ